MLSAAMFKTLTHYVDVCLIALVKYYHLVKWNVQPQGLVTKTLCYVGRLKHNYTIGVKYL